MNHKIFTLTQSSLPGKRDSKLRHLCLACCDDEKVVISMTSACGQKCNALGKEVGYKSVRADSASLRLCPACRQAVIEQLSDRKPVTAKVAGHVFHLDNVLLGIHSEETTDYTADLYCDGLLIGTVRNDGRGGMTFFNTCPDATPDRKAFAEKVRKEVFKITRFICSDGTKIQTYLGDIADELLYKMN